MLDLPLDPRQLISAPWMAPLRGRPISARGVVVGAVIGILSGLLLCYLALFGLFLMGRPDSAQGLGEAWFGLAVLATTVLGVVYYGRTE
jgi:hypothetical protein